MASGEILDLARRVEALEQGRGPGAADQLRAAYRALSEARELADDVAGRPEVAQPQAAARAISDLIRRAQKLVARAHG